MQSIVSIVVPCYNYGRFLAECLDSVLDQELQQWECIIVDNGSTDSTAQVAAEYCGRDARFSYVHMEQSGVSAARNRGVKESSGRYILPLDADDRIGQKYLRRAVDHLEANPDVKVVYCNAALFGAVEKEWMLPDFSYRELLIENSIFSSAVYRRADFERSGGYNENMRQGFEDWDFWIGLLDENSRVYKLPEVLFFYRIREGSRNNSLDTDKQLNLRKQIYLNHREKYDRFFSVPELIFETYRQRAELLSLKSSRAYQAGSLLARIFSPLKKLTGK